MNSFQGIAASNNQPRVVAPASRSAVRDGARLVAAFRGDFLQPHQRRHRRYASVNAFIGVFEVNCPVSFKKETQWPSRCVSTIRNSSRNPSPTSMSRACRRHAGSADRLHGRRAFDDIGNSGRSAEDPGQAAHDQKPPIVSASTPMGFFVDKKEVIGADGLLASLNENAENKDRASMFARQELAYADVEAMASSTRRLRQGGARLRDARDENALAFKNRPRALGASFSRAPIDQWPGGGPARGQRGPNLSRRLI